MAPDKPDHDEYRVAGSWPMFHVKHEERPKPIP